MVYSVLWISTLGDNSRTWVDSFSTAGIPSVLWRLFSTVGDNFSTVGITSVLWMAFSTVRETFNFSMFSH